MCSSNCSLLISSVLIPSTIVGVLDLADFFFPFFFPLFFLGGYWCNKEEISWTYMYEYFVSKYRSLKRVPRSIWLCFTHEFLKKFMHTYSLTSIARNMIFKSKEKTSHLILPCLCVKFMCHVSNLSHPPLIPSWLFTDIIFPHYWIITFFCYITKIANETMVPLNLVEKSKYRWVSWFLQAC